MTGVNFKKLLGISLQGAKDVLDVYHGCFETRTKSIEYGNNGI